MKTRDLNKAIAWMRENRKILYISDGLNIECFTNPHDTAQIDSCLDILNRHGCFYSEEKQCRADLRSGKILIDQDRIYSSIERHNEINDKIRSAISENNRRENW